MAALQRVVVLAGGIGGARLAGGMQEHQGWAPSGGAKALPPTRWF